MDQNTSNDDKNPKEKPLQYNHITLEDYFKKYDITDKNQNGSNPFFTTFSVIKNLQKS